MMTWTVLGSATLPAVPLSVAAARRFAAGLVPRDDTLILLVSEVTTNSVTHSDSRHGGEFTLTYDVGGTIRTEVVDAGGATVPSRREAGELATTGRGMVLIEDLAARSGFFVDDAGRLHTWFEL